MGEPQKKVTIERKNAFDWEALKTKVEGEHWRKLRIEILIRDKLHAGKPAQLDAAKAMLAARGLEEVVEAREQERPVEERAEEVVDEGLCEFHRREGRPGLWWPSNNLKAMIKENWSVLGYRLDATPRSQRVRAATEKGADYGVSGSDATADEILAEEEQKASTGKGKRKALQGSRAAIHEGLFVCSTDPADRDWIYLGASPSGVDQAVAHTTGPKGPRASIKRNEYVSRAAITFEVWVARAIANKIPDESFADMLIHAQEHGVGANRSQGFGRFDVVSVTEL